MIAILQFQHVTAKHKSFKSQKENKTMKKFLLILSMIGLGTVVTVGYNSNKQPDMSQYEQVIEKLNSELGSSISIPNDKKDEVYNNIKHISLEEFEIYLRNQYDEIKNLPDEIYLNTDGSMAESLDT